MSSAVIEQRPTDEARFGAESSAFYTGSSPRREAPSNLYARWLADFELVQRVLALPIESRQSQWLSDYRDFLGVALSDGDEAAARTTWCQRSVRRFLTRLSRSHHYRIADFLRCYPIRGVRASERGKIANVLRLFRSIPSAPTLAEGLGLTIVTPARG